MVESPPDKVEIDQEEKEIEQKMIKVISLMPKETQNRFKVLKILSDKRSKLSDEFEKEIKLLEVKMAGKKQPLYAQRKVIVQGELPAEELAEFKGRFDATHKQLEEMCAKIVEKDKDKKDEEVKKVDVDHLKTVQGIPDFWQKAIKNNHMI